MTNTRIHMILSKGKQYTVYRVIFTISSKIECPRLNFHDPCVFTRNFNIVTIIAIPFHGFKIIREIRETLVA